MGALRPLLGPLLRPLVGSITDAVGGGKPQPPAFNPASLYTSGQNGLWLQPSDNTQMWQDSARTTPVTAVTQPVGNNLDKSGHNYAFLQATSANRPAWQVDGGGHYYLSFDTIAQYIAVTGGTFSSNMDILLAATRTTDAVGIASTFSDTNLFIFVARSGSVSPSRKGAGSVSAPDYVNGVATSDGTRGALATAWPVNTMSIIELRGADMSAWSGKACFGFYSTFGGISKIGGVIVRDAMTTTERNAARTWLGAQNGIVV